MKGNQRIIDVLNQLLIDELTAINQYTVHAEMCDDWEYQQLHRVVEARAREEMRHASRLIKRILFLEGQPIVSELNDIHIGRDVPLQLSSDRQAEQRAIESYNEGIRVAVEVGDNGTRELLESTLADEEAHIDLIEAQLDQIEHVGVHNFLVEQIDAG